MPNNNAPAPSRRALLRGSGAALAVGGISAVPMAAAASAAPGADAELIRVCGEFSACDRQQRALFDGPGAIQGDEAVAAATAPIFARMFELLDRMEHLRATTSDGVAARAASLAQQADHWFYSFDARGSITGRLLDYLIRDAASLGGAVAVAPVRVAGADAELIRLCDEYMRAIVVFNRDGGHVEPDHDPLGHALETVEEKLDGLEARTIEGVLAKARVALFSAQQPDGSEDFSTSYTGYWPEEVIRDLLRLHGQAAA